MTAEGAVVDGMCKRPSVRRVSLYEPVSSGLTSEPDNPLSGIPGLLLADLLPLSAQLIPEYLTGVKLVRYCQFLFVRDA
jgi:hypothetical protein